MGVDDLSLDTLSLEEFHRTLQARLEEATAALVALSTTGGHRMPSLGGFEDATRTAGRHEALREQYVERLQRLAAAVVAAQTGTAEIVADYHSVEDLSRAAAHDIAEALHLVREVLRG